jgi:hypothetical protein
MRTAIEGNVRIKNRPAERSNELTFMRFPPNPGIMDVGNYNILDIGRRSPWKN